MVEGGGSRGLEGERSDETAALFSGTQLESSGGERQMFRPGRRRNAGDPGKRSSTRSRSSVLEWDKEQTLTRSKCSESSLMQELPSVPPKPREAHFNVDVLSSGKPKAALE